MKTTTKDLWPREKLLSYGSENLQDFELLALLLRTGHKNRDHTWNVIELSKRLCKKYGLQKILNMSRDDLLSLEGLTSAKVSVILAVGELNKRLNKDPYRPIIDSTNKVVQEVSDLKYEVKEHFAVLYLNARNELIHKETITTGILDASLVHPREVFEPAIAKRAGYIILVHNHPSGNPEPSQADIAITSQLIEASQIIGIGIHDHVIVANDQAVSLRAVTDLFDE